MLHPNENGLLHIVKPNSLENGRINFYLNNLKVEKGKKYALELSLKYDKSGYFDAALFRDGIIGTENRMFTRQQKLAAKNGEDIVLCGVPVFWRESDKTAIEKWYADFLVDLKKTNPRARIIPRINVNAPNWWVEWHPDSEIRYEDGKSVSRIVRDGSNSIERNASISSKEWQKAAVAAIERTVAFLEKNYGKYFMGYHICGGGTGEWAYIESTKWPPSGYDSQTLSAWRKWLKRKYGSNEKLRASWHKTDVTLDTVAVPAVKERESVPELLDPEKNQNIMDFTLFLNDEITDAMLLFAQTTKKVAPNKLLLLFYGYGFELSGCQSPCMPAGQGHFATEKLLNSPYVDGLCCPMSYNKRSFGRIRN